MSVCVCVCVRACVRRFFWLSSRETNCGQTKVIIKKNSLRARHTHRISGSLYLTLTHTHTFSLCNSSSVIHTCMDATCLSCAHTHTVHWFSLFHPSIFLTVTPPLLWLNSLRACVRVCVCVHLYIWGVVFVQSSLQTFVTQWSGLNFFVMTDSLMGGLLCAELRLFTKAAAESE